MQRRGCDSGRRRLAAQDVVPVGGPHGPLPKKLTGELVHWWGQELSTWGLGATAQQHPTSSHDFHLDLVARNVTSMLEAYYQLRNATELPTAAGWSLATSRCPPGCTAHGTCNEELGRCDCPIGRTGPDCSTLLVVDCKKELCAWQLDSQGSCIFFQRERCVNQCNARGACVSQFCHCFPGYFGSDCSLSMGPDGRPELLAGLGYTPNAAGPKVYVYELPPALSVWRLIWIDRPVVGMLWERLLSGGYRTARPEEADYFFVPVPLRACCQCNALNEVLEYLGAGAGLPVNYLSRNGARDHLMVHTGDWGRCEHAKVQNHGPRQTAVANMTVLQHWGLTAPAFSMDGERLLGGEFNGPCFYSDQDILLPPDSGSVKMHFPHSPWHPLGATRHYNRTLLGFLAGGICGWKSSVPPPCQGAGKHYSFGVREWLYTNLHNVTGFVVEGTVPDMGWHMRSSVFCFAPLGAGWGRRGIMAVLLGCIPVVVSDHVVESWEPFLDWGDFGLRVAQADLPRIEAILRAVTPQEVAAKQAQLRCVAKHISWSSVWGGFFQGDHGASDAMGTLMAVLAARRRHPGVPDAKLRAADAVFDDFMACRSPAGIVGIGPPSGNVNNSVSVDSSSVVNGSSGGAGSSSHGNSSGPPLCSYSETHGAKAVTERELAGVGGLEFCPPPAWGRLFIPGGAACHGAKDMASCLRPDLTARHALTV